jgi:hypothetical protein
MTELSETNVVVPKVELSKIDISKGDTSFSSCLNLSSVCNVLFKNKLYLVVIIVVLGIVIYYLYTTYFNKNKKSLLNLKNLYNKPSCEDSDSDVEELGLKSQVDEQFIERDVKKHKSQHKQNIKKKVNDTKKNKKVIIKSESESEPEHLNNLNLTNSEIEMINKKLLE